MKKSYTLTRLLFLLAFIFTLPGMGWGQTLLEENFNYTSGTNLTANGWTAHSSGGTQPITVDAVGLLYNDYYSSNIGYSALLDNTGEDVNKSYAVQSSGTLYYSFIVKVTTAGSGYFFHIGPDPIGTTFRGKVFIDAGTGSNFNFGLSKGSNTGTFTSGSPYVLGTSYLVVLKYEIVTGTTNDIVSLFVLNGTLPLSEPGTPTIGPLTDAAQTDINPGTVALRQYLLTQNISIDGIRIATSWAEAVKYNVAPKPVFSPANAETGVDVRSNITLTFEDAIYDDANHTTITDPASKIILRETNASGADVPFSASIDGNTVITVDPTSNLAYSPQQYYVALKANSVFDIQGKDSTAAQTVTFATRDLDVTDPNWTATYPKVTDINNTDFNLKVNLDEAGKAYYVVLADGSAAPTVTQIKEATAAGIVKSGSVNIPAASTEYTGNINSLSSGTTYDLYVVAEDVEVTPNVQAAYQYIEVITTNILPEPTNHVTGFSATVNSSTAITLDWTDALAGAQVPENYLILYNTDNSFTDPVDGTAQDDGAGVKNVAYGLETYQFTGLTPGLTYYFQIYPYTNSGTAIDYKTDGTIPAANGQTPKLALTLPNGGEVLDGGSTYNVTWSSAVISDIKIEITTNGTDWTVLVATNPASDGNKDITLPNDIYSTTCKIRLTDLGSYALVDASDANFTIVPTVSDIATLRSKTADNTTLYKLVGKATVNATNSYYNQKYIQDGTGAILIYDSNTSPLITGTYNIGDGITNVVGKLNTVTQMLRFYPTANASTTTGNPVITAEDKATVDLITTADAAELVRAINVKFQVTGNFANGTNYTLKDASNNSLVLRTDIYNVNYIGTAIPTTPVTITGVLINYNGTMQLVARNLDDFQSAVATLSDLTVGGTTVTGFLSSTYTYNVEVPYGEAAPLIGGTATDDGIATLNVTQALDANGEATIEVTAEDGITKLTYTVDFTEAAASTDATLSAFTVDVDNMLTLANITVADPVADAGATRWVADFTGYEGIVVTKNHTGATVEVKLNDAVVDPADYATQAIANDDQLLVTVTAQDGIAKGYYKVKFRTQPTLSITDPIAAQIVNTTSYDVVLDVQNFVLATDGKVKWTLDGGAAAYVTASPISLSGLDGGDHTVAVELVDMSNASLSPAITDEVTFNVQLSNDATLGTFTLGGVNMLGLTDVSGDLETLTGASYEKLDYTGFAGIVATPNGASATKVIKLNGTVVDPADYATQALAVGDVVLVDVTAQDAATHKYYKVTLVQAVRSLTIDTPVGETTIHTGETYTFTWTAEWVDQVNIDYTTDGGTTWEPVETNYSAALGSYTTPSVLDGDFGTYKFRITSVEDGSVSAETPNVILQDTQNPTTLTFDPSNGTVGVSKSLNKLTVTFSESVKVGTGSILVKKSDATLIETINVTSATITGNSVEIPVGVTLDYSTSYYIEIEAGAITDMYGNSFAGISGSATWGFTTEELIIPELFISEYLEGSSNNKALEIYNPTSSTVDLSHYSLKLNTNGGTTWGTTLALSGNLLPGYVYVVSNASAALATIISESDITSTVTYYNGNDAVGLFKDDVLIDIVGVFNEVVTTWSVAGVADATAEHTLVRKGSILKGNTDFVESAGTNTTDSEWEVYGQNIVDYIGWHIEKQPELAITSPVQGVTITTKNLDIVFTTKNFVLNTNGHVKYSLDGGADSYTDASPISLTGLTGGAHTATLELVDMSNASLDPAYVKTLNFTANLSTNANLSDLAVSGTTVAGFDVSTLTYDVELPFGTTDVPAVTYTLEDSKATAIKTDAAGLPGSTTVAVTAEDGTTIITYTINFTVTPAKTGNDILTFTIPSQVGASVINTTDHTVTVYMVTGTNVTALIPTITVSESATIDPLGGIAQDFSNPVVYTVTSQADVDQDWTITVLFKSGVANITGFTFTGIVGSATINTTNHTVTALILPTTNITTVAPVITVSDGATINPTSGTARDFTGAQVYTVTAEAGNTQDWTVTLTPASTEAKITVFTIPEEQGSAVIDHAAGTIAITVITGTDPADLVPTITLSAGATVDPLGGISTDFTSPVTYTVTAQDGVTTKDYVVTVTVAEAPNTETDITNFDVTNMYGNEEIDIDNHKVTLYVHPSVDLTSINPTIGLSAGATVLPASGAVQDFTSPVTYTVTAQDGTTNQDWEVTIIKVLTLTSPLGGETFNAGGTITVTWTAFFTGNVNIKVYSDVISDYISLGVADAADGTYTANIPNGQFGIYRARVEKADETTLFVEGGDVTCLDAILPTVTSLSPVNGAQDVLSSTTLVINFDEAVSKKTGNIKVYNASDVEVASVSVTDAVLSNQYKTATITLPSALAKGIVYYVNVDATAFADLSDNLFAGIADKTTWTFTTEYPQYTITVTAGLNGTTTPNTNQVVDHNGSVSFTIAPSTGYHIKDVLVDGSSVGAVTTYEFTSVIANHTFETQFEINSYTIAATVNPVGAGSVTGTGTYTYNQSVSLTAIPNSGYTFVEWKNGATSVGTNATYTFNATENVTLEAVFTETISGLLFEGFTYNAGDYIGGNGDAGSSSNNWTTHSVTAGQTTTINILDGSLSYNGLKNSTANKVLLFSNANATSRDVNRPIGTSTATVMYYSALVKVLDNSQLSTTADYFMSFGATAGSSVMSLAGRLGIRSVNTGANFRLAIGNISGGTGMPTYTDYAQDLTFGTTYLVVVKVDRAASPVAASLWVNPITLGTTEPVGSVSNNSGSNTFAAFASMCLRNSSATPKVEIDEIRVGETFADVTPVGATTPTTSVSTTSLANFGNVLLNTTSSTEGTFNVSGQFLTGDISIVPPAGFEVSKTSGGSFAAENPILLTPASGIVAQTAIYVRFKPTIEQAYTGNISITSAGAPDKSVAVSGTGYILHDAFVTSTAYTVDGTAGTITNVPATETLATFKSKLTAATGALFEVYQSNGTTVATDLQTGYKVIVTAQDGYTKKTYTVTLNTVLNNETDFLSFSFDEQYLPVTPNTTDHTIAIQVIFGTNPASLVATFDLSGGASAKVNGTAQVSGTTVNDFTSPVTYTVTAEDGTTQDWTVTVSVLTAPASITIGTLSSTKYYAGDDITITWTYTSIANVLVEVWIPGNLAWETLATVPASDGTYTKAIPADASYSTAYKLRVSDASNAAVNSESAVFTIIPTPTINTIQSDNTSGASNFDGSIVKTSGVVTGLASKAYFLQDGEGAWNGVYVYLNATPGVAVGDNVTIEGEVDEYYGLTEIKTLTSTVVNSTGNALPAPVTITTGQLTEQYEGVLVKIVNATVITGNDSYNVYTMNDGSGVVSGDDDLYKYTAVAGEKLTITGFGYYSNGAFKILPRTAADVQSANATITSIAYTVDQTGNSITNVPYDETLEAFKANITPAANATYQVYESNGTTVATDLLTGYRVKVTAQDGITTKVYEITKIAASNIATVSSTIYTVDGSAGTITNVPKTETLAAFKLNLTPAAGATFEVYQSDGSTVASDLQTGYKVIVIAQDESTTKTYTVTLNTEFLHGADILTFSFAEQAGPAIINATDHTINIEVAYGTSISSLTPTFTLSTAATATVDGNVQLSGITFNNYTTPVTYVVTAEDGSNIINWVVTVTVKAPSTEAFVTSTVYTVDGTAETITNIPWNATLAAFKSNLTPATYATFQVYQSDGTTVATNLQTGYKVIVTAQDGTTKKTYIITMNDVPPMDLFISEYIEGSSNNKAIEIYNPTSTAYDLSQIVIKQSNNGSGWGEISTGADSRFVLPLSGTIAPGDVLVIANSLANASILAEADIVLVSSNTANGCDGCNVASFNGDDAIGLFKSDVLIDVIGIETTDPGTGWDVAGVTTATADHTMVRKDAITIGTTDWTASAGTDAATSQWVVNGIDNVSYLGWHITKILNTETDITAFSFAKQTGPAVISSTNHTIGVEVLYGTDPTALVASFTLSKGAKVYVSTFQQYTGTTPNNFTAPVVYHVVAEDGTTAQDWTVTVTVAVAPSNAADITSFSLAQQTGPATINATNATVEIEVATGTNVTMLAPTIAVSAGATINPLSGVNQNFTDPINYTVTAQDGTTKVWTVTVTVKPVVPIYDIQYTTDASGNSPLSGQVVTTTGIVTALHYAWASSVREYKGFFMQDSAKAYNGIYVYTTTQVAIGDSVVVKGTVAEYYNLTEISPTTSVQVVGQGTVPAPVEVSTLNANSEGWEGVLIKVSHAACTIVDAGNGMQEVNDGSGALKVDDDIYTSGLVLGNKYNITGVGHFTFSEYKLLPRDINDIQDVTGINDNTWGRMLSAYPNPFSSEIRFVGVENVSRVVVTNLTGQVVMNVNVKGLENRIDTEGLLRGLYIVTFVNDKGERTMRKMIKE